jgi:hypothetical protein
MQDRRREQRWPAYLGGTITYSKRVAVLDCLVRNISPRGARLTIASGIVPDAFELHIPQQQAEYHARMRWRSADAIGVEFSHAQDAAAPVPLSLVRRIKRLENENAGLRRRLHEET